jgi:multicomponent Na+:H+ antiporter subunit D
MTVPLPVFVVLPLVTAFVLPLCGDRFKRLATFFANVAVLVLLVFAITTVGQSYSYQVGRWSIPLGINMVLDGLSSLLLVTISVIGTAAMLFSVRYMEQYTAKSKYLSLFMLMLAGMNGVVLSGDIFNVFVFLEIASIASYALVGFGCGHEQLEASFKYAVLGSVASSLILFAIGLVYGNTGTLNMAYISQAIQTRGLNNGLSFALAMFIAGFGLKAALVPFHAWLPDAHPAAPAPISAMLSGVLIKALGVYTLVRLLFNVFGISETVSWVIIVLGVLSMVVGALLGIGQADFKRLLAYSSVSQVGYIFLGIGLGGVLLVTEADPLWASLAILGGLFHLLNHAVSKSLLFLTSGSVEMTTGTRQFKQLGGLSAVMPLTRANCVIASASIVGIPPFGGFWSKLILVIAAVGAGIYWAAALIVVVSVCTLVMYLKVHRYIFLGELPENLRQSRENKGTMFVAMTMLALLCIAMGALVLVPALKSSVLDPAVEVLVNRFEYSAKLLAGSN